MVRGRDHAGESGARGGHPVHAGHRIDDRDGARQGPNDGRANGCSSLRTDAIQRDDLDGLRRIWPHKLIVKGMLNAEDAAEAVNHGADGIDVSSNGGRNLDGIISPMEALPEVVDAVGKRATVFCDSGFRRASDVVKALCLGAHAVMIGRATLYGVAPGGEAGAVRALKIFRDEIHRKIALPGVNKLSEFGPQYLKFVDVTRRPASVRPVLRAVPDARAAGV